MMTFLQSLFYCDLFLGCRREEPTERHAEVQWGVLGKILVCFSLCNPVYVLFMCTMHYFCVLTCVLKLTKNALGEGSEYQLRVHVQQTKCREFVAVILLMFHAL